MTDELARNLLLAGCAVLIPIGLYHRIRSRTDERLDRRQEGWLILLSLRPLGIAAFFGLVAFLIDPTSMAWASIPLPGWLRWFGLGIGIVSGVLLIWTFRSLGHNLTDTVVTRRNATLVTHGPYRWIRHPFYSALAIAVVATALLTANIYVAITGTAVFVALVARTTTEENKLIDRFGFDYVSYMQQTGRFLPRFRRGPSSVGPQL